MDTKHGSMVFIEDFRLFRSIENKRIDIWNICGKVKPPESVFNPPKMIVLHGNVPVYLRNNWRDFARENEIYLYDLEERGMLRLKL